MPPIAQILSHRGAPTLFIHGQPTDGVLFDVQDQPRPEDVRDFAQAGVHLFTLYASIRWGDSDSADVAGATSTSAVATALSRRRMAKSAYSAFDRLVSSTLEADPQAHCLVRVYAFAPEEWCRANPQELTQYANPTGEGMATEGRGEDRAQTKDFSHESFASEKWLCAAQEELRDLLRHVEESSWRDRIFGYLISAGFQGEWHYWSPMLLPDTSPLMLRAFRHFLRQKYGDDQALQMAWGDPSARIRKVAVPDKHKRLASELGMFRDPIQAAPVVDYYQCHHLVQARAIEKLCQVVKEARLGVIAGAMYGYLPDWGWLQDGEHLGLAYLLGSPFVDFFASPHTYYGRDVGQDGMLRTFLASLRLHGKFFFDEADDRTHITRGGFSFQLAKTPENAVAFLRREFGNALTHQVGMWWCDLTGGWFRDPALMQEIAQMARIGQESLEMDRERAAQIAVIADLASIHHLSHWTTGRDRVTPALFRDQFRELARMGAPYDLYLLEDLLSGHVPPAKLYVFLNTFHLSADQREGILRQCAGGSTIWLYAPGFSGEMGLDGAGIAELTGMKLVCNSEGESLKIRVRNGSHPLTQGLEGLEFGRGEAQSPMFSVQPTPGVEVLGVMTGSGRPGLACLREGDPFCLFSAVPPVPWQMLRNAARLAGVHLYLETGDIVTAGGPFLALHTTSEGEKCLKLPFPATVTDAFSGQVIARNAAEFTVTLPAHSTFLYRLAPQG